MFSLGDLVGIMSLDIKNIVIERGVGSWLTYDFEVCPSEFVKFAKYDISDNTKRGLVNALTNAKRAIDCQVDSFIESIGYSHDKSYNIINDFVKGYESKEGTIEASPKLKFIRALEMAPTGLISRTRMLRNKLEHHYNIPDIYSARDAIEISELFICTIQYKMRSFIEEFSIYNAKDYYSDSRPESPCLYFCRNIDGNGYDVRIFRLKNKKYSMSIDKDKISYLHLIKLSMALETGLDVRTVLQGYLESAGLTILRDSLKVEVA